MEVQGAVGILSSHRPFRGSSVIATVFNEYESVSRSDSFDSNYHFIGLPFTQGGILSLIAEVGVGILSPTSTKQSLKKKKQTIPVHPQDDFHIIQLLFRNSRAADCEQFREVDRLPSKYVLGSKSNYYS